jgi:CubicO group peptidase (beta-lactamase class C family)
MRKNLLFIIILFSISAKAQSYQQLTDSLQAVYTKYDIMGMSLVAIKNNRISYTQHFGYRDFQRQLPVTDSTLFRIASISKNICATALLTLYDKGLVHLDEDVEKYLHFKLRNPAFPEKVITLRMLLSHTSSLFDGDGYGNYLSANAKTPAQLELKSLLQTDGKLYSSNMFLNKVPGTYFTYANINFGIIGTIIESVSQKRYDQYVEDVLFKPLGIKASNNLNALENINQLSVLYRKVNHEWEVQTDDFKGIKPNPKDLSNYQLGNNGLIYSPTGGVRISALDLAKYMQMLMNNGTYDGIKILKATTAKLMRKAQWQYDAKNGDSFYNLFNAWGMGTHIIKNKDGADVILPQYQMYGHSGEAYGLISNMYYDPKRKEGFVLIINGSGTGYVTGSNSSFYSIENAIHKLLYQKIFNQTIAVYPQYLSKSEIDIQRNKTEETIIITLQPEWKNQTIQLSLETAEGKVVSTNSQTYSEAITLSVKSLNTEFCIIKISANNKKISAKITLD